MTIEKLFSLLLLFVTYFVFNVQVSFAQCPQNLSIGNQSSINSFLEYYPDCTDIPGDLNIVSNATDLSGLAKLKSIGGNLRIDASGLNSLTGLHNIESIGGDLIIGNKVTLTDLTGLEGLKTIGKDFYLREELPSLTSLKGLENITSVFGRFWITGSNNITDLDYLSSLEHVGDFNVSSSSLIDISGLFSLISVEDNLWIRYCPKLNLDVVLPELEDVGGELRISHLDSMTTLDGFYSLTAVGGSLFIGHNENHETLSGFDALTHIEGELQISTGYFVIDTVYAFNSVKTIGQGVSVLGKNISFDALESVGGSFHVGVLNESLAGCNNLMSVGGNFTLPEMRASVIPEFEKLETIGGYFSFYGNDSIKDLNSFNNLTRVEGAFYFRDNNLKNISAFQSLKSVGDAFEIRDNPSIESISSFNALETVGGNFRIENNALLESISGFNNLQSVDGSFEVWINFNLSECSGFCNFIELNAPESLTFSMNATGCKTLEEICPEDTIGILSIIDLDINTNTGNDRRRLLKGAHISILEDGKSVNFEKDLITNLNGQVGIPLAVLDSQKTHSVEITFEDRLLSMTYPLDMKELEGDTVEYEYPISMVNSVSSYLNQLADLKYKLTALGGLVSFDANAKYDLGTFPEIMIEDVMNVDRNHEIFIESVRRRNLGLYYMLQYFEASTEINTKMTETVYKGMIAIGELVHEWKKDDGFEDSFDALTKEARESGNSIEVKAIKNVMSNTLTFFKGRLKNGVYDPYLAGIAGGEAYGANLAEYIKKVIVGMEYVMMNTTTKDALITLLKEMAFLEGSKILVQNYYINTATPDMLGQIIVESVQQEGTFPEVVTTALNQYNETEFSNSRALAAGDIYAATSSDLEAWSSTMESFSQALVFLSGGTAIPAAGVIYEVAQGFKVLGKLLSGLNIAVYGNRFVRNPNELGYVIDNLSISKSAMVSGTPFPDGYFDNILSELQAKLVEMNNHLTLMKQAIEDNDEVAFAQAQFDFYEDYTENVDPIILTMQGLLQVIAPEYFKGEEIPEQFVNTSTALTDFELSKLTIDMMSLAYLIDDESQEIKDGTVLHLDSLMLKATNLTNQLQPLFNSSSDLSFGPFVRLRDVGYTDTLETLQFTTTINIENIGTEDVIDFDVLLEPNENLIINKINGNKGSLVTNLSLSSGKSTMLTIECTVIDAKHSVGILVDFRNVRSMDQTIVFDFFINPNLITALNDPIDALNDQISIHPNPATDKVFINYQGDKTIKKINIVDITGHNVITSDYLPNGISISNLSSGVFFVHIIIDDNIVVSKKLVHIK